MLNKMHHTHNQGVCVNKHVNDWDREGAEGREWDNNWVHDRNHDKHSATVNQWHKQVKNSNLQTSRMKWNMWKFNQNATTDICNINISYMHNENDSTNTIHVPVLIPVFVVCTNCNDITIEDK